MSDGPERKRREPPGEGSPSQEPSSQEPPGDPAHEAQPGDRRREPPLVAFGIVAGTAVGGIAGLIAGAFLLGAGIGCAAGVIIGAAAQALLGRR